MEKMSIEEIDRRIKEICTEQANSPPLILIQESVEDDGKMDMEDVKYLFNRGLVSICRWIRRGRIPAAKIGGKYHFYRCDVFDAIDELVERGKLSREVADERIQTYMRRRRGLPITDSVTMEGGTE